MKKTAHKLSRRVAVLAILLGSSAQIPAQTTSAPTASVQANDDDLIVLSPFEITASSQSDGYTADTTLAGNRLNTKLRDVGSSVTVVTSQFLRDTGATNNTSLLQRIGAEVGGVNGNFAGSGVNSSLTVLSEDSIRPNENTRIRGLAAADNTRDFFRSEIPWDSYNTDRIDVQHGPNSILFGQGSPAGIINAGSKAANFHNSGEIEGRYGSYGSARASLDVNQVIVDNQVAVRLDVLNDHKKYEQKPAFSNDQRISGAIRIEPEFLKKNGNRTYLKVNGESGQIDSNNPRILPPTDHITPWFTDLNQQGLNGLTSWIPATPTTTKDLVTGVSAARPNFYPNLPAYEPQFTNGQFLNDLYPLVAFQSGATSGTAGSYRFPYLAQNHGSDRGITFPYGGFPGSWLGLGGAGQSAIFSLLPYANGGAFKDASITDPSVFDFYHNLIDGNTKKEWQRFWSGSASLVQSFLNEQVGFSLDYYKEHYEAGQLSLFGGAVPLYVDVMSTNNDGQSLAQASANPGFGKAFVVSNSFSNNSFATDRENKRATGFVTRDLRKEIPGFLGQLIGTHTLTGLVSDDSQRTSNMSWQRYGYIGSQAGPAQDLYTYAGANFQQLRPTQVIYLSDSLKGKSLNQGLNISRISGDPTIGSEDIQYFDFTADPAGAAYPTTDPRHYVGWNGRKALSVYDTEADGNNRKTLAYTAGLRKQITTSQALVWQGKLLDGALVGMYGWRKDINKSWASDINLNNPNYVSNGLLNFDTLRLASDPAARVEVQSRSYSIVAHLGDLPGIKEVAKTLPVNVSLSYNESTNFKPDSSRFNINGEAIGAPKGKTIDKGILIETRDGKYSLKVNRYVTTTTNGTNPNSQAFASELNSFVGNTAYFANRYYYHNDGTEPGNVSNVLNPGIGGGNTTGGQPVAWFFDNNQIHTQAMEDQQNASTAAVRDWETKVNAAFPNFWKLWGYNNLADMQAGRVPSAQMQNAQALAGFTIIENAESKGWEIELNAHPIKNWRMSVNATRTDAVRTSIGDAALGQFMQMTTDMVAGNGGKLHWWWGTADVPFVAQTYFIKYGAGTAPGTYFYGLKSMENVSVGELAKWRFNMTQNYEFTQGFLRNFNVGGGLRYQSATIIGYPPGGDPAGPPPYNPDLSKPYKGPSETYVDLWIGYRRKLTDKITWNIQLNVENVGKKDSLLPVSLQGPINGVASPANYRIAPSQIVTLTNRFEF